MDFDTSSQARSWLFDSSTLVQCRQKALTEQPKGSNGGARVRSFASGFHSRHAGTEENLDPPHANRNMISSALSVEEQEMLVRYHAQQIGQLIGPVAVVRGLVRNSTVQATAIMLFRRFYISNSVLHFEPRRLAVASAYLASKIEEQRVEVSVMVVTKQSHSWEKCYAFIRSCIRTFCSPIVPSLCSILVVVCLNEDARQSPKI